ncbi:DUF3422 family protein [Sphingopyxis sp. USTB-05]|uniref:DUF3422 family protein n=1 Tax=Sphingopyxis sp. USTB-05 TaxID=2830667 RepID=UPI002078E1BD|nr:DUF3422 family protein [Sphingopyxis sp. USTB-05]
MVEAVLANGDARISSDFLPGADGFIRIDVIDLGMTPEIAGAHVQRILELETYRTFALLGLPSAEKAMRAIAKIEDQLPDVTEKMDAADSLEDNRHLLDLLSKMTLEIERSSAASHFRLGAARAYSELVRLRLAALSEQPDPAKRGLAAFFSRRFDPAIRTCTSALDREAILARKLTRAAQLLRTRVEIALESQNRDLPPSEWSKIDDILDDEGDMECRARSVARKRLSVSCVKRRLCWRRALRPPRRAVGSRSASRPIIGGARNMAV